MWPNGDHGGSAKSVSPGPVLRLWSRRFSSGGGGVEPVRGDKTSAVVLPEPGVS